jgi:hypothetical protein
LTHALLYLLHHGCQLRHVAARVDHFHTHDHLVLACGGKLHVEGGAETPITHLHHARIGVRGAGPGLLTLATVALLHRHHLGQLVQCRLDAPLALLGCAQLGRLRLTLGPRRVALRLTLDVVHQLPSLQQMLLQAGFAAKRCPPRIRPHPHAVLGYAL